MSVEVACSQCQGRLRAEQSGVVACPHCGTHLTVNVPPADAPSVPEPEAAATVAGSDSGSPAAGEQMPFLGESTIPGDPPAGIEELDTGGSALDDEDTDSVLPGGDDGHLGAAAAAPSPTPATAPATPAPMMPVESEAPAPVVPDASVSVHGSSGTSGALPEPDSVIRSGASSSIIRRYAAEKLKGTVSKTVFVLVLSYASAVTLAALYLGWQVTNGAGSASELESLPDVKPARGANGAIGMDLVPVAAEMPAGHTLALGETRRFGNLEVTPVKVTRGPVKFEFYAGDDSQTKEDGDEILQLWFQFRNVSEDQSIAPLDALVFRRLLADDVNSIDRANTFVCATSQKKESGFRVLTYEWNDRDIWNLRDQDVEYEIPPQETFETYVPTTEEGVAELLSDEGPYTWRVQFRKGYSPRQYGVTTVIEVEFDKADIVAATGGTPKEADDATAEEQS